MATDSTTVSVRRSIYRGVADIAKPKGLSVSAVTNLLLHGYMNGTFQITAHHISSPQFVELKENEITPVMKEKVRKTMRKNPGQLHNLT